MSYLHAITIARPPLPPPPPPRRPLPPPPPPPPPLSPVSLKSPVSIDAPHEPKDGWVAVKKKKKQQKARGEDRTVTIFHSLENSEKSILSELLEWADGRRQALSPMTATCLGLDLWQYKLCGVAPTPAHRAALCAELVRCAKETPLKLWLAIRQEALKEFLGPGFEWVCAPRAWPIHGASLRIASQK